MKILLISGTGVMGVSLARQLSNKGHDVYVTSRKKHSDSNGIHYIQCNIKKGDNVDAIYDEKWDSIVDYTMYYGSEFESVFKKNLECTDQYVFVSSSRVFADVDGTITEKSPTLLDACEDSDYLRTNDYALDKARHEKKLRESGYDNWTIIRPYITYGENRLQLGIWEKEKWLYRLLEGRTVVVSKDVLEKITTLTNSEEVSKYVSAIIEKRITREDYNVVSRNHCSWNEIMSYYNECVKQVFDIDVKVKEVESVYQCGFKYPSYQFEYDRKFNRLFDNSKAQSLLEDNYQTSTKENIKKELLRFSNNGEFLDIDWKREALFDKITKERARRDEFATKKQYINYLMYRYFGKLMKVKNAIKQ